MNKNYYDNINLILHHSDRFNEWWSPERFNDLNIYITYLAEYCTDYFLIWFDKSKIDYNKASASLAIYCHKFFDYWYDEEKFSKDAIYYLIQYNKEHIDKWNNKVDINEYAEHLIKFKCDFKSWFNKDVFDYSKYSVQLALYSYKNFDLWWDKEKFNYNDVRYLIMNCPEKFHFWYDNEKVDINKNLEYLLCYCSDNFDIWFDINKIDYKINSSILAIHGSKFFDKWFDKNKFDYNSASEWLAVYCSKYFNIWWDADKFNKKRYDYLIFHCNEYFKIWFNKDTFDYNENSRLLAAYSSEYIELWWDQNKFNCHWKNLFTLKKYCSAYSHIWLNDYISLKLKNIEKDLIN